jgi:F-type H+-transporting ATPase subunit delta
MAAGTGARRYAEALFDLATQEKAVDVYRDSLDRLARAFTVETVRALQDDRVPSERRRAAVDAASKEEPKAIRAVLQILLQRDRIGGVPDIARAFNDLVDKRAGVVHAKVTTSIALDDQERSDVVRRLEQASGKKIKAAFAVDPSIIGGAKVQIGDRLIDASLSAQLDLMARQLASS